MKECHPALYLHKCKTIAGQSGDLHLIKKRRSPFP